VDATVAWGTAIRGARIVIITGEVGLGQAGALGAVISHGTRIIVVTCSIRRGVEAALQFVTTVFGARIRVVTIEVFPRFTLARCADVLQSAGVAVAAGTFQGLVPTSRIGRTLVCRARVAVVAIGLHSAFADTALTAIA